MLKVSVAQKTVTANVYQEFLLVRILHLKYIEIVLTISRVFMILPSNKLAKMKTLDKMQMVKSKKIRLTMTYFYIILINFIEFI